VEDREMGASERLDVETDKESPADFALWKAQKPGEPAWKSPWGMGRPGWHIECSAMSMKYLGETFDIHCGGKDLLFPHHENEIAQSEGATGRPFVHYWMHNGFINVDNQKMSKSLNNFFTVRDISKEFDLEAVRLFMLSAHYRSPINFSREQIEAANASLNRLYTARDNLIFQKDNGEDRPLNEKEQAFVGRLKEYEARFDAAMDDDLNTADALGAIFELVKDANVEIQAGSAREAALRALESLNAICGVLGILTKASDDLTDEVRRMVEERAAARASKDWKRSDELRDAIRAAGYILEDTKQGQKVRKDPDR
jgi:cysteinyl-tRNA synthetase